jgi:rhodanese-related sulfurtransferase
MNRKNIGLIIIIAVSAGFLYNFLLPGGLPLIRKELEIVPVEDSTFNNSQSGNGNEDIVIRGLNLDQTYNIYTGKMATFIDSRDQWEYQESHIEGAVNIPEFSFNQEDPAVKNLPKDEMYVIYCDGDDCDVSKRLAADLSKLGFTNVYVFLGGIYEWIDAGYPTEGATE